MKKIIFLMVGLILLTSLVNATDLPDRFGIGNKIVYIKQHPKMYFTLAEIPLPANIYILPYVGIEANLIFYQILHRYEQKVGVFVGAKILITKNINIGADVGLYYIDIWEPLKKINRRGFNFNFFELTIYF